ncbi:hypothetical protein J1N35_035122 [Gossypium stocksii]|uniref:BHLH domain-containing protein n=1 Tax=Gossypium stocksii TaxID=47602 RepID=A0A9D3UTB8_9ROSI|nr:hypothetical protein J1N35_035122 [Gossypium stocksii]
MDAVFHLDAVSRAEYLQSLTQSIGCSYICLWSYSSYLNPPNCLIGWDGCYTEENTQPVAFGLFLQYQQLIFPLENNHSLVPGFAFANSLPYIELRELDLQNRGSNQTQRQFYQRAVFMGCRSGEIELGLSNVVQLNMEIEMTRFFPEDFPRQLSHVGDPFPQPTDLNRPSSFSSSLRSLSTGSPIEPTPSSLQPMSSSIDCSCQQAMQALTQMQSNIQLPMLERENASITKPILAVLTSLTSHLPRQNQNLPYNYLLNPKATAFNRYVPRSTPPVRASLRSQSILKRATLFYRKLTLVRRGEQLVLSRRPTSNQLHRMMSERRRREKQNEDFIALRSLLPFGTKKDKASILFNSRQYLTSLKAQVAELSKQNQLLQARLLPAAADGGSSNESLNVWIIPLHESTSEQRIVDLRISVRGEVSIENILMRLLEFLRHDRNVSIMSIEANNQLSEGSVNYINLRLRIEGNIWDEFSFLEAVRRLVANFT